MAIGYSKIVQKRLAAIDFYDFTSSPNSDHTHTGICYLILTLSGKKKKAYN